MKRSIQTRQCESCSHCIENKYYYYTHDNRMVECHLYTCRKYDKTFEPTKAECCLGWEEEREILD